MTNTQIQNLIDSCDKLQQRTISAKGFMHSSSKCFDVCMRLFDCEFPAHDVTFNVYFNVPVMKAGFAKIYRDGHMEMWTSKEN